MKNFVLACLTTFSLTVSAQSYLIMDNGTVITMDKASYVYDLGHDAYPNKITLKGGKFFVEENSIIATIDENGYLFRKYEYIPDNILGKGSNYFLSGQGELYTINEKGEVRIIEDENLKMAGHFGGNYFVTMLDPDGLQGDLYTVDSAGMYSKKMEAFQLADIASYGGNYFVNRRGVVHTIDASGNITAHPDVRIGVLQKKGGNYFTDSSGMIYTVAADGSLKLPSIPVGMTISSILKLGSSYFLDLQGHLYVVDNDGNIFQRAVGDLDFKRARVISL